ncbi:MAG: prepilin-type N-terminal cleavage/methylation domain-containing protein [Planctomycetota bacterium]|nr:MAG: prepilin-type N-terminal cleavage/methylation domain-containing protein [Planctomycetota bacterium]
MRCRRVGKARSRPAFTLIELLVVVAIIALLISILLPSLARARELSRRVVCAANMSGMGKGFYTYANENSGSWPAPNPHQKAQVSMVGTVSYVQRIGIDVPGRGLWNNIEAGNPEEVATYGAQNNYSTNLSTTRAFWMLVRSGASSPASFICPSSDDTKNDEDNPQFYWDFGNGDYQVTTYSYNQGKNREAYEQCSYGYQVPFGQYGNPSTDSQMDMPLAADKGPFGATDNGDGGKTWRTGDGIPPEDIDDSSNTITVESGPDEWRFYNSPNHGGFMDGEGQNILFADSHAEFFNKPIAGVGDDNIYTAWMGNTDADAGLARENRFKGRQPTSNEPNITPWGNTDALLYP